MLVHILEEVLCKMSRLADCTSNCAKCELSGQKCVRCDTGYTLAPDSTCKSEYLYYKTVFVCVA